MHPNEYYLEIQKKLKVAIHQEPPTKLENLTAALLGKLLDLPVAVAKSGFQHGGDAGSAGQQGRHLRIECKRYKSTTSLSARELLGEIDHAIARDEELEAWVLVATRDVSEQLAQDLTQKGDKIGVPVVILDWRENDISDLAALCAYAPDIVKSIFSEKAGQLANDLKPISKDCLLRLKKNLQSWELGFERLREISHENLTKIWNSPRESKAKLGQNAAVGAEQKKVERSIANEQLSSWWEIKNHSDAPAAVIGLDGVGKTWATIDWLVGNKNELPIILVLPSTTSAELKSCSETEIMEFIAHRLYELTGVRSSVHWSHRLANLFKRPSDEGPVITVFFDGLNQEPSVEWLKLLKTLQGEYFSGRLRVIVSIRNHFFEEKLAKLRGLIDQPNHIVIEGYDIKTGGELDQMLAYEGLKQSDLHPELIRLARVPRLFNLVVLYREKLVDAGQITIHRLLWEYGRDTLGERSGRSFSEIDWRSWLKKVARKYLTGINRYSMTSLSKMTSREDLSRKEVYCRLSDIVDGHFAIYSGDGDWVLDQTIVSHALAAALLAHLDISSTSTIDTLTKWLDPIAGLDQRAEILRAAVSILVEKENTTGSPLASVLVTAWLQTQNVTENHQQELIALAPLLCGAFLAAIEQSKSSTHSSARLCAVNALRAIPRDEMDALGTIVKQVCNWFKVISRGINRNFKSDSGSEKKRSKRLIKLVGIDESKKITVVGLDIEFVDWNDEILQTIAPAILEGFPLVKVLPVFEAVAVAHAVGRDFDRGWKGMNWLCLLNEIDPQETAMVLRKLAKSVRIREPESGIHPKLPIRIAELLLWLTGQETDENTAISIAPRINHPMLYKNDYLVNPGRSFLALERRHAASVLSDMTIPLLYRIQRAERFWIDPSFIPPITFVKELHDQISEFDIEKLNRDRGMSSEDHTFKKIKSALARCVPNLLSNMERKRISSIFSCPEESQYWKLLSTYDNLLLPRESEIEGIRKLLLKKNSANDSKDCEFSSLLLMISIQNLSVQDQFIALIDANLKYISEDFDQVLLPPTSKDVDELITRYNKASSKQQSDFILLLTFQNIKFSDSAWIWLCEKSLKTKNSHKALVFRSLALLDANRFGKILDETGWSWRAEETPLINHYGSGALIEATRTAPFEKILHRIAPWRILEAARVRGANPNEMRLAAELFKAALLQKGIKAPDPGVNIFLDRTNFESWPFGFSISRRRSQEERDNPMLLMKNAFNQNKQHEELKQSAQTAIDRIREAQEHGASLFHADIKQEDLLPLLEHATDIFDQIIEGFEKPTDDFRCRVLLAETVFMAICELLLSSAPAKGVLMWKNLREIIKSRILGTAQVDDLIHMVFRVLDSEEVNKLRKEILEMKSCNTDLGLCHIAIAMSHNERVDLLKKTIESDSNSVYAWKRKRGIVLDGFSTNNSKSIKGVWPEGEVRGTYTGLKFRSARLKFTEACARHWWQMYLKAESLEEAHSTWILFSNSADHRAWLWMHDDIKKADDNSNFFQLKLKHAQLNQSELKRAMDKRFGKLDTLFLGQDIFSPLGPWH